LALLAHKKASNLIAGRFIFEWLWRAPVRVEGDPVQYQIKRTALGWIVEIVNNEDVIKKPSEPAVVQKDKIARVILTPQISVSSATLLRDGRKLKISPEISLNIPAGETYFVVLR